MWKIKLHPLVVKEDIPALSPQEWLKIKKAIRKKLTIGPIQYGEPLRGDFKGFWKLRVGKYRVVYKIDKEEVLVLILTIGLRKDFKVYKKFQTRYGL